MRHGIGWSIVFVVSLGATLGWNQTSVHPQEIKPSYLYSCLESPSLSVAASTPYHDAFPAVKLSLVDPKGQVQPRITGKTNDSELGVWRGCGDAQVPNPQQSPRDRNMRCRAGELQSQSRGDGRTVIPDHSYRECSKYQRKPGTETSIH
jgi:hypothetical protein